MCSASKKRHPLDRALFGMHITAMSKKPDNGSRPPAGTDAREARLAEALRANLRRRKAAAKPSGKAAEKTSGTKPSGQD